MSLFAQALTTIDTLKSATKYVEYRQALGFRLSCAQISTIRAAAGYEHAAFGAHLRRLDLRFVEGGDTATWWEILNSLAKATPQLTEIQVGFAVANIFFCEDAFEEAKSASSRLSNLAYLWPKLSSLLYVEGLGHPDDRMFYLSTIPRLSNLQHLSLSGCESGILAELTTIFTAHNKLHTTFPQDYPGLTSLELGDIDIDEEGDDDSREVQRLLRVLPNLQRCVYLQYNTFYSLNIDIKNQVHFCSAYPQRRSRFRRLDRLPTCRFTSKSTLPHFGGRYRLQYRL